MKTLLHVGCGHAQKENVPVLQFQEWNHVRVDIDESVKPDVRDDIRFLYKFENESVDGVFSSHNLEHLESEDVPLALRTFWRVLKPGGMLFIMVPDFRLACEWVAKGKGDEIIYASPAGPITPMDMIFGYRRWTRQNEWQRHRTGYTVESLRALISDAGFAIHESKTGEGFDIIGFGEK